MTAFVALLRAVNVGGTGSLPMARLREICVKAGFARVRTHITSGNALFDSDLDAAAVKAVLEPALTTQAGRPVRVMVRTADELAAVAADNPFPEAPGDRVVAIFLDGPPPADVLNGVAGRRDESIVFGRREIYVLYDRGQGDSKLRIPAAAAGTARNLNTVARLAELAAS